MVGARLLCYESMASCTYGHPPSASYQVVGAASGNDNNTSFRLVSNQGTFLLFSTPTHSCRDVWLGALGAGLERQLLSGNQTNEYDPNNNNKQWKKVKPRCQPINSLTYKMPNFCHSCGKVERLEFPLLLNGTPLCQYGEEERVDICPKCQMAQGVVDDCVWISELYASTLQEQEAIRLARRLLIQKINPKMVVVSDTQPVPLELKPLSHDLVSRALQGPECLQYIRVSPTLQRLSFQFQQGYMGVLELAEVLEHAIGIKDPQLAQLKTQAFRVAGDMGTALKLLHENALPPSGGGGGDEDSSGIGGPNNNSTELLQCILEFFLDLLEDGELATLGFFWPQLLNIHLQMLPATNAASLKRIELMEDFLLTVATKYSIHLAAELIWSHTADLEDSKTLPYCAKRKSSVLRFLCELESLLFDFDKGWGGGSVTVGQFLSPSNHQIQLLKLHMQDIQNYRLQQTDLWLSRSQRMDKLKTSMGKQQQQPNSNNLQSNNNNNDDDDDDDDAGGPSNNLELMAQEALRIAKNADYLSSHLAFTKRLCDIAEKLRFLPVPERPTFLQRELSKLNASGTMGGDPLNKVKTHHSRVVRIPTTEGHVFRSKERTPVLLLVEINDEGAEPDESILRNGKANAEVSEEETLVNNESAEEDNGEKTAAPDSNEAEETGAESKEFTEGVASDPKEGDEEDLGIQSIESEPTKDDSKPAVEDSKEIPDVLEVFAAKEEKGCITPEEAELPEKAGEDDEDFHSAHGSETKLDASDVVTPLQQHKPVLRSPSKDSHDGVRLSGSQEGMSDASEKSRRK